MGERVAHLITGRMLDYIEFDDGFAIAKVRAPQEAVGRYAGRDRRCAASAASRWSASSCPARTSRTPGRRPSCRRLHADRGRRHREGGAVRRRDR